MATKEELEQENARLREDNQQLGALLNEASGEDVAALRAENADLKARLAELESPEEPTRPRTFVLSEGVRDELERTGKSTDPNTGDRLERDPETGEVKVVDRTGAVTTLDVAALNPPK